MVNKLSINQEPSLKYLDEIIFPQLYKRGEFIMDLSGLNFTRGPFAVNLLLLVAYLDQISDVKPILIPPENPKVVSFLSNMRFFVFAERYADLKVIRPIPNPTPSKIMAEREILEIKYIPSQRIDTRDGIKFLRSTQYSVFNKLNLIEDGAFEDFYIIYSELCKNVYQHSESFGFVAAQYLKTFQIIIGDLGIGFFSTLEEFYQKLQGRNFIERFGPAWDELKALDIAFCPGVTRKNDIEAGKGLWYILNIISERPGSALICRSSNLKMSIWNKENRWETKREFDLAFFPGVQLEVYVSSDKERS